MRDARENLLKDSYSVHFKDPNEKSPLVRYGSVWTRVLNDKVVIGIPLFCVSKR